MGRDMMGPRAPRLTGVIRINGRAGAEIHLALWAITPFPWPGAVVPDHQTRRGCCACVTQDREDGWALAVKPVPWLSQGVLLVAPLASGGAANCPRA